MLRRKLAGHMPIIIIVIIIIIIIIIIVVVIDLLECFLRLWHIALILLGGVIIIGIIILAIVKIIFMVLVRTNCCINYKFVYSGIKSCMHFHPIKDYIEVKNLDKSVAETDLSKVSLIEYIQLFN